MKSYALNRIKSNRKIVRKIQYLANEKKRKEFFGRYQVSHEGLIKHDTRNNTPMTLDELIKTIFPGAIFNCGKQV